MKSAIDKRRKLTERYILLASKLLAPVIEDSFSKGYDWILETIKSSLQSEIALELEISKSIQYLKSKDFSMVKNNSSKAVQTLKEFEKRDGRILDTAAVNLSFLYFLDGDIKQSEKYSELAVSHDKYNSKALTNRGNCYFAQGNEWNN